MLLCGKINPLLSVIGRFFFFVCVCDIDVHIKIYSQTPPSPAAGTDTLYIVFLMSHSAVFRDPVYSG